MLRIAILYMIGIGALLYLMPISPQNVAKTSPQGAAPQDVEAVFVAGGLTRDVLVDMTPLIRRDVGRVIKTPEAFLVDRPKTPIYGPWESRENSIHFSELRQAVSRA